MNTILHIVKNYSKLFVMWILLFDFQRILFSIHNWDKLDDVSFSEWLLTFVYSFRLDLATAAYLSIIPLLLLCIGLLLDRNWLKRVFYYFVMFEVLVVALIHAGEINAYTEWNHKLTSRVFMHLAHPDEVFRTADYLMTFLFFIYAALEVAIVWLIYKWLFDTVLKSFVESFTRAVKVGLALLTFVLCGGFSFLLARGGWQQIPINIDSAYFSKKYVINDISVNSAYFFANSYMLYLRSDIDHLMPKIDPVRAQKIVKELFDYNKNHEELILKTKRPNVVFVIMESWAAEGIGCLSSTKGATPQFDALAKEGLLFTNIYATGHTSEIGNSSIFSGQPALPEIAITLQPDKHRKLRCLNQDLKGLGYSSHYLFGGDLKYGNIGSYFMDHGFDQLIDEEDFPSGLPKGKLNYYDSDVYKEFLKRINGTRAPFMHCVFTGSTHSPYDHPKSSRQNWKGKETDFMNSLIYADECLGQFMRNCKSKPWYDNTIFVFVADHGHATPQYADYSCTEFYRIPLLIWGEPLKQDYRGKRIDKVGSQIDIPATILNQMGQRYEAYPWSKDLLNPNAPAFALHTTINGYGWVTDKGSTVYEYFQKKRIRNTFKSVDSATEIEKGNAFLVEVYRAFKGL
ncbi:sulfatase-like hydrolase/transferase [Crocinitomicaceae bacterium]|nr:sulfatase-like hydrolase/transferase [Crocinitomicaceae bacterium]